MHKGYRKSKPTSLITDGGARVDEVIKSFIFQLALKACDFYLLPHKGRKIREMLEGHESLAN